MRWSCRSSSWWSRLGSLEARWSALIVGLIRESDSAFSGDRVGRALLIAAVVLLVRPAGLFGKAT